MKKIENLRDLFIEQGRELYGSTYQEERALHGIEKQAGNTDLKKLIEQEITLTRDQRKRLEGAFSRINASFEIETDPCCESLISQTRELIERSSEPDVRDAVIINGMQKLNHLKISGLGTLAAYANQIGEHDTAQAFHEVLEEEWEIDRHLSRLAERQVNRKAAHELYL